jgi:plasmid stabilization system protein ParE
MASVVERLIPRRELEDIAVLIGRDRPLAAKRFLRRVRKTYELLAAFASLGAL